MAEEFDKDTGEKTEEPSQHRIDEFRRRGEVASSKELTSILILFASILTLVYSTTLVYEIIEEFLRWVYQIKAEKAFVKESLNMIITKTSWTMIKCIAPICITVAVVAFISNFLQIGVLFAPEVISWKLDRINPINGLKKLFSMQSVVEAAKGFLKFVLIISIIFFFIRDDINSWQGFYHIEFPQTFYVGNRIIFKLFLSMLGALSLVALGDLAWQKIRYQNKLRMTREQAKRDQKEHDGNPEIKQKIRTIQREMSNRRMIDDVKKADVIVTNPTHLSVALWYEDKKMISPKVVAKGADHMAMKIREVAKEYDIPLVENVPLARALYETVNLNAFIPRVLYSAVAEVLSFVYKLKRKKKLLIK